MDSINHQKSFAKVGYSIFTATWHKLKITCALLIFTILFSSTSFAQGFATVDFHQAQNDRNGAKTYVIDWVNGILNSTHTDYFEGIGVPQRIVLTGIEPNTANANPNKHSLRFQVLAEKGGKHAYDFPISWEQAYQTAANIGNGTINELQNLWTQQCDDAFSAQGKAACDLLDAVIAPKVQTASFPNLIGNPGDPALGAPNVNDNITCFETIYSDRTIEIRGNEDISNVSVTFNGYKGSGKDLAEYTLIWESTSDMVMIRFATHLASGNGTCGYGSGQGAGSINGGPYHVTLERLDDVDGKAGVSLGSQDNQIMSNAVQIPPTCGLENGTSGCPETPSFSFDFTGTPNVSLAFSFVSNTAGASFANGSVLNTLNAVADASGNYTVIVYPAGTDFIAGGSFKLQVIATNANGSTTCSQETATFIEQTSVVAKVNNTVTSLASPYALNSNQANPQATLTALGTVDGIQDNTLFTSFTWSVASGVIGNNATTSNLSSTSGDNVTFTPTAALGGGYVAGLYAFEVTAVSATGCTATARVYIDVSSGATCPGITGPTTTCAGTEDLVYTAGAPSPGDFLTYVWSIDPSGAATIEGADGTGKKSGVSSITVNAGTANFTVVLTIKADNGQEFNSNDCRRSVTVYPNPTCSINGQAAVCSGSTNTHTSTINPTGGTVTHLWSITGNGTISGSNTGATVTVIAGASGSYTVRDDITRNGCPGYCTKTVTINSCDVNCTYTQGYYGNTNGNSCDGVRTYNSPLDLIKYLLGITTNPVALSPITVGRSGYSVIIPATVAGATKLNSVMPGGQTPKALLTGNCNITATCFNSYLTLNGRINNVLLSQTITLILNSRINGGQLAGFQIRNGWLTTQRRNGCGLTSTLVSCGTNSGAISSIKMNANVVKYLTNNGANNAYVSDLISLANDVLGRTRTPGQPGANGRIVPSFSDINSAVDAINRSFDKCRSFLGYYPCQQTCFTGLSCQTITGNISASREEQLLLENGLSVSAYPNPYTNKVKFTIESNVSGMAQLEVFNMLGQKVNTVYKGLIQANRSQAVDYDVPAAAQKNLVYILRIGDKEVTGKLLKSTQ